MTSLKRCFPSQNRIVMCGAVALIREPYACLLVVRNLAQEKRKTVARGEEHMGQIYASKSLYTHGNTYICVSDTFMS